MPLIEKNLIKDNFIVFNSGYRISIPLFRLLRWIIVLYAVISLTMILSHPFYYVENPSSVYVENPSFGVSYFGLIPFEVSSLEFLPPYFKSGYKMPSVFLDSVVYCLLIIGLFALFNHLKYNREVFA